jgi:hypothetical protein
MKNVIADSSHILNPHSKLHATNITIIGISICTKNNPFTLHILFYERWYHHLPPPPKLLKKLKHGVNIMPEEPLPIFSVFNSN